MPRQFEYRGVAAEIQRDIKIHVNGAIGHAQEESKDDEGLLTGRIADAFATLGDAVADLVEHQLRHTQPARDAAAATHKGIAERFYEDIPETAHNVALRAAAEGLGRVSVALDNQEGQLGLVYSRAQRLARGLEALRTSEFLPTVEAAHTAVTNYGGMFGETAQIQQALSVYGTENV